MARTSARRWLLPLLVLVAAGGAILGVGVLRRKPPAEGPLPDIVFIVWDTCRADRLSLHGHPRPTPPWLETFAKEAVTFDRCTAPAPWTAPSHGSMFTGLVPSRHGLRIGRGDRVYRDVPMLAETLSARGYATAGISANPHVGSTTGLDRGFSVFVDAWKGRGAKTPAAATAEAVRAAAAPLLAPGRRPLFLFVNFLDPHMPHAPPAEAVEAVRPAGLADADLEAARGLSPEVDLTLSFGALPLRAGEIAGLRALYDADVRAMDGETGALLAWLREKGIGADALVLVAGDHGEALGERGLAGHRLNIHEEVLHVPLVVRWPGRFDGGRRSRALVSLLDLHPLVLAAAGVPAPAGTGADAVMLSEKEIAGRILVAEHGPNHAFLGDVRNMFPSLRPEAFEPVHWMFQSARRREGGVERKFLRVMRTDGPGAPWTPVRRELYDLDADPGEARDLLPGGSREAAAEADLLERALPAPSMPSLPR